MNKLNLPDFLGIGAQKSATSWLNKMLRNHPDLYMPEKKEVHFFDKNYLNGLEWYSNHFMFAGNKVKGEVTPAYAILGQDVIQFIKKMIPDVRLIFLMRNPIDRAWSHALMEYTVVQGLDYERIADETFIEHFNSSGSISRGDYAENLTNWFEYFPREQFYLGFYEDVSSDPKDLLQDVFSHIGVDPDRNNWASTELNKRVLKGKGVEMPDKYRDVLSELYKDRITNLYTLLNDDRILEWK